MRDAGRREGLKSRGGLAEAAFRCHGDVGCGTGEEQVNGLTWSRLWCSGSGSGVLF